MTDPVSQVGLGGSVLSLLAASACCVLPLSLMIAGVGGNWAALFSPLAAASPYILGVSVVMLAIAWTIAYRRRSGRRTIGMLSAGSALSAVAWLLIANDDRVTAFLLTYV